MIFNASGGGGSGGTLTVTAPVGVTITVSNGVKTKVKTADAEGKATFKGLATGTWMVTISNGSETATDTVEIVADYAKTMAFFAATIAVTYPEGSTCTCSDGSTTLTAPDTSGSYTFTVPNAGTWIVTCKSDTQSKSTNVNITKDGQSASVTLAYITYFYKNGDKCTAVTGGWSAGTASDGFTAGTPSIGSQKITCYSSGASTVTSAVTSNKVDLTDISKLTIVSPGGSTANNGYYGYFCVRSSRNGVGNSVSQVMIPKGKSTVTLDVSGLTGSYYLMLRIQAGASGGDQVDMSECYGV